MCAFVTLNKEITYLLTYHSFVAEIKAETSDGRCYSTGRHIRPLYLSVAGPRRLCLSVCLSVWVSGRWMSRYRAATTAYSKSTAGGGARGIDFFLGTFMCAHTPLCGSRDFSCTSAERSFVAENSVSKLTSILRQTLTQSIINWRLWRYVNLRVNM